MKRVLLVVFLAAGLLSFALLGLLLRGLLAVLVLRRREEGLARLVALRALALREVRLLEVWLLVDLNVRVRLVSKYEIEEFSMG